MTRAKKGVSPGNGSSDRAVGEMRVLRRSVTMQGERIGKSDEM